MKLSKSKKDLGSKKENKESSKIEKGKIVVSLGVSICIAFVSLMLGVGIAFILVTCLNNTDEEVVEAVVEDANPYEMDKVNATETFDIEGATELNRGLLELNKKFETNDMSDKLQNSQARICYGVFEDKEIDFTNRQYDESQYGKVSYIQDDYENGLSLVYENGKLTKISGYEESIVNYFKDYKLANYLISTCKGNVSTYLTDDDDEQSLVYHYYTGNEEETEEKTETIRVDGENSKKSYLYSVNNDSVTQLLTFGIVNSGLGKKVKVDSKKVEEAINKKKELAEKLRITNYEIRVDYNLLADAVMSTTITKAAYVDSSYFEVETDDLDDGYYENTENGNKELTEEMGFQRNKEGLIVNELPEGYEWYTDDSDGTVANFDNDGNYYYGVIYNNSIYCNSQEEIEKRKAEAAEKARKGNFIMSATVDENTAVLKVRATEEEYNEYINELNTMGFGSVTSNGYVDGNGSITIVLIPVE